MDSKLSVLCDIFTIFFLHVKNSWSRFHATYESKIDFTLMTNDTIKCEIASIIVYFTTICCCCRLLLGGLWGFYSHLTKGQLISECLFDFLKFQKNLQKIWQISAQEHKRCWNHQNKDNTLYYYNLHLIIWTI